MKSLHPLTWWLWSIAIIVTVIRADSAIYSIAVVLGAAILVSKLAGNFPWSNSFWFSLRLGIFILIIRALTGVLIGVPIPGTKIAEVPIVPLPSWMAGIRIGGVITQERLLASLHEGLVITSVIALFGAAVSLTSPHKMLRVLPVMVYEFGVALVIATSSLPQLVASYSRIKRARVLRGDEKPKFKSIALPLLEEALSKSLDLAAAMDARGYGVNRSRSRYRPINWRVADSAIFASGLIWAMAIWMVTK
jgi:energy-coupling factor transporter transmembrane protein EcfT